MIDVLIYVQTDPLSGGGHFHRSANLGLEFISRGCNVSMVGTKGVLRYIPHKNLKQFELDEKLDSRYYDLLVIDNYQLNNEDHRDLRKYAKKLLVLDDLCNRKMDCDFLWDPTITRKADDYKNIIPNNCVLFIGGEFQIFSEEHINYAKNLKRGKLDFYNHIHFYMGYSKIHNLAEIEKHFVNLKIPTTHLGASNADLITDINSTNEFSLNPIETYSLSKLGVGSPGNMLWERGSIGVPSYILINNRNQINICEELMDANLLHLGSKNWSKNQCSEAESIFEFYNQPHRLNTISEELTNKINITGKHKIVTEILLDYDCPKEA